MQRRLVGCVACVPPENTLQSFAKRFGNWLSQNEVLAWYKAEDSYSKMFAVKAVSQSNLDPKTLSQED
jgi:hypothetical protein